MSRSVLIIGGGVIGLCTAYYALRSGLRVTVLEREAPGHDGCSLGNAGLIVPSHFVPLAAPGMVAMGLRMMLRPASPFYIRPRLNRDLLGWCWKFRRAGTVEHVARASPLLRDLLLASRCCYDELAAESGNEFGFVRNGLLVLCQSEERLHEETLVAGAARGLGLSAEVLTPEEAAKLQPDLHMEIAGAIHFADDGHIVPQRLMAWLIRVVEQGGAEFRWSTEVSGWRSGKGRIEAVQTPRGEFSADEYVLAAGSWSPSVARELGVHLPLQPGKGYNVTLPHPKRLPRLPMILAEARVAVTPMENAVRFAGTMEMAGLDRSINPRRVDAILRAVPRYLPELAADDLPDAPAWSGLRPCSPDGLPYLGRLQPYGNLSVTTGHAMLGMSLGPITGRLMAEILSGSAPSLAIDALSPNRFG
jgi:D-amino-acid dehydrogenase